MLAADEMQASRDVFGWQEFSTNLSTLQTTFQRLVDKDAFGSSEFSVGSDGAVFVGSEMTTPGEVAAGLARLSDELSGASTLSDYSQRLLSFFDSLNGPIKLVLVYLLLPYLISVAANLTMPTIQDYWKQFSRAPRKQAVLAVQEAAASQYEALHLESYRFVIATCLRVHAGYQGQNDIIDKIAFGQVVKVLEFKGRRTRIEFLRDTRDKSGQGWVASRYLAAFSR
jgi:hypothetical protein